MPPAPRIVGASRPWSPLKRFLQAESAGGALLILSAALALVWANSAGTELYERMLELPVGPLSAHLWVNDGLMAVFFLLVGLELRREMTVGELASATLLAAPALAALGGMVAPAVIFSAFNWHDRALMRGWAVPVATDIAFALAVLGILGHRVPVTLKVFLTALAIIDDLGAIVVIALFYSADLRLPAVGGAVALLIALFALNRSGVRALAPYLVGGAVLWLLVFRSGLHATLAGVALAFVLPARGERSPALRLEHALQPWVAFLVLPLFGLFNAGLRFDQLPPAPWRDTLALGTAAGLVLGKQLGVFGAALAAARLGLAKLPSGVTLPQLWGGSVLCGIGFTMSLFIGELAFRGTARGDEVRLAVFVGSLFSAAIGLLVLRLVTSAPTRPVPHSAVGR